MHTCACTHSHSQASSSREAWGRRYALLTASTLLYGDKRATVVSSIEMAMHPSAAVRKDCKAIDLARFALRKTASDDGITSIIELYCPYVRARVRARARVRVRVGARAKG